MRHRLNLLISALFLAAIPSVSIAQQSSSGSPFLTLSKSKNVEVSARYDEFEDHLLMLLTPNNFGPKSSFVLQGIIDRKINEPNQITLSFMAKRSPSDPMTVKYTNCSDLKMLADGKLVSLENVSYFQDVTEEKVVEKGSLYGTSVSYQPYLIQGISSNISLKTLQQIANATTVKAKVCNVVIDLSSEEKQGTKAFYRYFSNYK